MGANLRRFPPSTEPGASAGVGAGTPPSERKPRRIPQSAASVDGGHDWNPNAGGDRHADGIPRARRTDGPRRARTAVAYRRGHPTGNFVRNDSSTRPGDWPYRPTEQSAFVDRPDRRDSAPPTGKDRQRPSTRFDIDRHPHRPSARLAAAIERLAGDPMTPLTHDRAAGSRRRRDARHGVSMRVRHARDRRDAVGDSRSAQGVPDGIPLVALRDDSSFSLVFPYLEKSLEKAELPFGGKTPPSPSFNISLFVSP